MFDFRRKERNPIDINSMHWFSEALYIQLNAYGEGKKGRTNFHNKNSNVLGCLVCGDRKSLSRLRWKKIENVFVARANKLSADDARLLFLPSLSCYFCGTRKSKQQHTLRSAWNGTFVSAFYSWWILFPFSIHEFSLRETRRRNVNCFGNFVRKLINHFAKHTRRVLIFKRWSEIICCHFLMKNLHYRGWHGSAEGWRDEMARYAVCEGEKSDTRRVITKWKVSHQLVAQLTVQSTPSRRDSHSSTSFRFRNASWSFHWRCDGRRWWCSPSDMSAKLRY